MPKLLKIKNDSNTGFKIINKSETNAELIIYSEIGETYWGEGVSAKSFNVELKELPKSVTQIDVRLNSPGGNVFDGIVIYNRLKQHSANVTVYIDGIAASIASIIALAGDEVIMSEGSMIMIHKPMSGVYGNSQEMLEMVDRLDEVEEQLIGIYRRKTNLDRTEIKDMLSKETWMDAQEAVDMGFADSMMEEDEEIKIAASFNKCPWVKNRKELTVTNGGYVQKQIDKFKEDAEAFLAR